MMTFLFAGHDTTTNLIAWCLHLLATHPATLNRLHKEMADTDGPNMHLRSCLLETLRLYPSVPLRSRTLKQKDVFAVSPEAWCPMVRNPDAVELPGGTGIGFGINCVHTDPLYWQQPEVFDPSRFEAHAAKEPSALLSAPWTNADEPLSYLAFGAGPRRCIGERLALMEAEEVVGAIVRHCVVEPDKEGPPPEDVMHLTMRSKHGIRLYFKSRHINSLGYR